MSEQAIYRALCPRVAVLSSPDVAAIAHDNGCDDFAHLLRPFESQVQNVSVRTSQLKTRTCPTFPLRLDQLSAFEDGVASEVSRHPEEVLDEITAHIGTHARHWDVDVPRIEVTGKADLRPEHVQTPIEQLAPWFADFRELILGHRAVSEHETFGHPIAMLIIVSSACPDPMNAFAQLYEQSQQPAAYAHRPYMHLEVLRYYIVLHDVSRSGAELDESKQLLDNIRKTYGLQCCILPINSAGQGTPRSAGFSTMWTRALRRDPRAALLRPNIATPEPTSHGTNGSLDAPSIPPRWRTPQPEPQEQPQSTLAPSPSVDTPGQDGSTDQSYGAAMDDEDVRRLKAFLREFTAQSLVPHIEKCVQVWNEQVMASRRGITGKLFGAGRRMFGAARATTSTQPPGFDAHRQIYPSASNEALTRRLADFAFITRDLKLAASLYEMARKDFVSDKAWKYAAGASEMLGLCQLLQAGASASASSSEAEALLSQACHEYSLGNHTQLAAIRASLLYYEALRSFQDWRTVEPVLMRAAGSAEEISSAIFLEQAALVNLRQPRPALRKYAVRLVMAGHRYHDCGQTYLALRCYAQAAAFYRTKDWSLISNHIEHELGKQAYMEGDAGQAVQHLLRIIRPAEGSTVPASTYLNELFSAFKYIDKDGSAASQPLQLAFELFPTQECAFDASASGSGAGNQAEWSGLEERFLRTGYPAGASGPDGRPRKRPLQLTPVSQDIVVGVHETLSLVLTVRNPMATDIDLRNIRPSVIDTGSEEASSSTPGIEVEALSSLSVPAKQSITVRFKVTASRIGQYRISGVAFTLDDAIPFFQPFEKKGPRLYATKEHKTGHIYGPDRTLAVRVRDSRPQLVAELLDLPSHLYHGEEATVRARLVNVGHDDMFDIRLLPADSSSLAVDDDQPDADGVHGALQMSNSLIEGGPVDIAIPSQRLAKGESVDINLRVRGPSPGPLHLQALFVYQNEGGEVFNARLSEHVDVQPSVLVTADYTPLISDGPQAVLDLDICNVSASLNEVRILGVSAISSDKVVQFPAADAFESLMPTLDPSQVVRASITLNVTHGTDEDDGLLFQHLRSLLGPKRDAKAPALPTYGAQRLRVEQGRVHASGAIAPCKMLGAVRRAWRLRALAAEFHAISELDRERAFPLFDANEVDLLVHWESLDSGEEGEGKDQKESKRDGRPRHQGFIPIFGIKLGPLRNRLENLVEGGKGIRSLYAETAKEQAALLNNILTSTLGVTENPVLISLLVENLVAHDFAQGAARIPVKLKLKNLSDRLVANFQLQLLQHAEDVDAPLPIAPWIGRTSFRGRLEPGSTHTVTAHMFLERPAVSSSGPWCGEIAVEAGPGSRFVVPGAERVLVNVQQGG